MTTSNKHTHTEKTNIAHWIPWGEICRRRILTHLYCWYTRNWGQNEVSLLAMPTLPMSRRPLLALCAAYVTYQQFDCQRSRDYAINGSISPRSFAPVNLYLLFRFNIYAIVKCARVCYKWTVDRDRARKCSEYTSHPAWFIFRQFRSMILPGFVSQNLESLGWAFIIHTFFAHNSTGYGIFLGAFDIVMRSQQT